MTALPANSSEVPYVPQSRMPGRRTCGAAALAMVYRSFGLEISTDEIWSRVASPGPNGSWRAHSHRLAHDARRRGLDAAALRAESAWQALEAAHQHGLRVVLNHRLQADQPWGHYSVLVDVTPEEAVLHDPLRGPSRTISRKSLLQLWTPSQTRSEVTGRVLVVFSDSATAAPCDGCQRHYPGGLVCPRCGNRVSLSPAVATGCLSSDCGRRCWKEIFCTRCDLNISRAALERALETGAAS